MEQLLNYVWKHKIFPLKELQTTTGLPVEVIDAGLPNKDAGPDFFNSKVKINGTLWIGNIEIHTHASDWFRHGHAGNKAYDSVILHVVEDADEEVYRTNGELIPQLQLTYPAYIYQNFNDLLAVDKYPCCHTLISKLPDLIVHSWMSALQSERFQQKEDLLSKRLNKCNGNWEDAFLITLARNFGFGLNGDVFEQWATLIPLRAVDKHRDNLFQIEAIFFGQAGLLEETIEDVYYQELQKEFRYLKHKFELRILDASLWRFLRLRPGNFPHVRIAQLAYLYNHEQALFSRVIEAVNINEVNAILHAGTSEYWKTHYHFYSSSPERTKSLSKSSLDLILINTVITFLYAYGKHKGNIHLCDRAQDFLETLRAENNYITRMWKDIGLDVKNAADSQALLQLKKGYCDQKKCLYCRIGFEYLKRNK